ncbi:hypothetical protein EAH87_17335 [Sphingomonas koreensis]|nr:hypothetical protein EAH87_17335 [Sphingomonas koreensis]
MSKDWPFGLFASGFGLLLAIHCSRAAWREFSDGIAEGVFGNYARDRHPVAFWLVVIGTFLAGVMGVFFMVFGVSVFIWGM